MGGVGSIEGAINKLKPVFQNVFGWIANTAVPWVANAINRLKPIFDDVFGWIAETAIPAVTEAIQFLVDRFNDAKDFILGWVEDNESGLMKIGRASCRGRR